MMIAPTKRINASCLPLYDTSLLRPYTIALQAPQFKQKTATFRAFLTPTSIGEDSNMRSLIFATAALALVSGTTAQAAQDAGLSAQNYRSAAPQSGVGAQLGMTLKLDSKSAVRDSERVQIGFAAGPVMMVPDAKTGGVRRGISSMAGFSLRPGYSATLTFAGQPIATRYTVLGAAEETKDEASKPEKKKGKGPSTVGWIAIGVGGLVLTVLAAGAICAASRDGNCITGGE
jgi:hypothetical protein